MKKRMLICLIITLVVVMVASTFVTALATQSTGVKGDLNYDGVLNRKDYSALSTYIKNGTGDIDLSQVDFDGDGFVNESDKTAMLAVIVSNFDNNGDGEINVVDFNLLEMYLAKFDGSKLANFKVSKCDYNGDGQVDFSDLNLLGYYEVFEQYSPRY